MRTLLVTVGLLAIAPGWSSLVAADQPSADESAVGANAQKYVEAFNRGDGAALAALWRPEAVYVDSDTGEQLNGRPAIQERFTQLFAAGGTPQLTLAVTSVRFITPDVAMEDGIATIVSATGEEVGTSYTAVSVKQKGVWLLDSVRETTLPPPPTAFDQLQPLAFLVGEWVDSDESSTIRSVFRWSANGAFLTQTFSVVVEDRIDLQGTQIIGWDQATQQIRSWLFDSDGGFGEGTWNWDGKQWVIHAKNTLPDGRIGSALNVYRPIDVDTLAFKSTARQVAGELLPNVDEVLVVRVSSEIQAAAPEGKE